LENERPFFGEFVSHKFFNTLLYSILHITVCNTGRSCPTSVRRGFGSHCSGHISCGFVYPGYTFMSSPQPAHEAITTTTPLLVHTSVALCTRGTPSVVVNPQKAIKPSPLTPKHKQQQPKSNNSLIDYLPSLCLEGLLSRRGAHGGGSTRTRLLFTVVIDI
jgi:hypothetical protein